VTLRLRPALVCLALVAPTAAYAVDPNSGTEPAPPSGDVKGLSDYLGDLSSGDGPKRLYAARTVRFETRRALHAVQHAPPESLASLDAQSALVEIEARAPDGCLSALHYENTAVICAEILADLARNDQLPVLRAARSLVKGTGPLRRFDAAVATLAAIPEAAPAPASPAPASPAAAPAPQTP